MIQTKYSNTLFHNIPTTPFSEFQNFEYDRNGNQTRDLSRGVSDIQYNELNLPEHIEMASGGSIEYLYTAAGTKLAEFVRDEDDQIINRRDYAGMFEYEADSIVRIALASGYVTVADTVYHLYALDYQGNIVAVYNTATGQQEHYKDYYPYGLPHAEMPQSSSILPGLNPGLGSGLGPIIIKPAEPETETPSINRRWYGAKELTTDHGLNTYDFEARVLTPAFPRFTTPDGLCESFWPISPYIYCVGDPINWIDNDGNKPTMVEAARMCDDVYNVGSVNLTGGWIKSFATPPDFKLVDNRTGFKSQLYERTVDGVTEYAYAFSGTDMLSTLDWINNYEQLLGKSEQYAIAMNNAEVLIKFLSGHEVTFIGHSLGGGMAAASAYRVEGTAMTFNAAGVSSHTIKENDKAAITAYVHNRDELNQLQQLLNLPTANGEINIITNNASSWGHPIINFYKPQNTEIPIYNVEMSVKTENGSTSIFLRISSMSSLNNFINRILNNP